MKIIVAALTATAALCATASAEPDHSVLPTPTDQLQEIAYEFRFPYQPAELGTDALRDRLRVEAGDYCVGATREAGLSEYAGLCTRIVMGAVTERLAEIEDGRRFASN